MCAEIVPMCGDFYPHPSRRAERRDGQPGRPLGEGTKRRHHPLPPARSTATRPDTSSPAPDTAPHRLQHPRRAEYTRGTCTTGVRPHSCTGRVRASQNTSRACTNGVRPRSWESPAPVLRLRRIEEPVAALREWRQTPLLRPPAPVPASPAGESPPRGEAAAWSTTRVRHRHPLGEGPQRRQHRHRRRGAPPPGLNQNRPRRRVRLQHPRAATRHPLVKARSAASIRHRQRGAPHPVCSHAHSDAAAASCPRSHHLRKRRHAPHARPTDARRAPPPLQSAR